MPNSINIRSSAYCIAFTLQRCGSCATPTPVVGLVLPPGHETLETDAEATEETPGPDVWEPAVASALIFLIDYIPEAVQNKLREFSPHYHFEPSEQAQESNWMNHCAFCRATLTDFELYCEPEGAFLPISEQAVASTRLYDVREPFEAQAGGYAYLPEFLDALQRE